MKRHELPGIPQFGRDQWLTVVLEEYKAVRAEILASMQQQQQVIAFGVTVLAAVGALTAASVDKHPLLGLVLGLFGPVVSFVVMLMWIAEVERMTRAGTWVALMESRLRLAFQQENLPSPLGWESSLRGVRNPLPTRRVLYKYRGLALVLTILGSSAGVVGFFSNAKTRHSTGGVGVFAAEALLASLGGVAYVIREKKAVELASFDVGLAAPWT